MKISKFLFSTLVAAAAMTSTAFAEGTVSTGGTEYDSFDAAFNAAKEGDVLNISGSVGVGSVAGDINKSVDLSGSGTIDLGGKNFIIGYKTNDAVVTITEDSDISFTNGNGQGVIVSGARENDRFNGTFIIDNARVSMDYLLNRNITTIKGDGSGIISEKANLSLTKGVIIGNRKAETGGAGLGLFTLTDNAYVKISDNTGHATEIGYESGDGHLVVEKNSTFDNGAGRAFVVYVGDVSVTTGSALIAHSVELKSDTALLVSDSTLTAGTVINNGTIDVREKSTLNATSLSNSGYVRIQDDSTLNVSGTIDNVGGVLEVYDSTLQNQKITGCDGAYIYAEGATFENVNVSGQETRTVNTDFNGGNYTGKVYTGYGIVDGKWAKIKDSESTITGTVDASTVYWQNYGKLTIEEGAELKTLYFSEASTQVLTVNGTISAGTFRGYNGIVSETGKINAQAAVQFYGNPDVQRQYDVAGEIVVTHDIAYAHNVVIGFNTTKQWYGDGPNDYWNIGGANTVVNISGEKAKLQIVAGKAGKGTAIIHVDEEGTKATLNITNGAEFVVDGKVINNGNLNIADGSTLSVTGDIENAGNLTIGLDTVVNVGGKVTVKVGGKLTLAASSLLENLTVANEGGEVVVQAIDAAVTTQALTVESIDGSNVNLSAGADIVVNSATKIENISDIIVSATDVVLAAWSFDIDNKSSDVTVTMDVGTLSESDQANLKILHKADGTSDWTVTDIKGEYKDGKVTFTTNSFSSYAVAIPEPSAFGLLAGLGAIALAVSRRRRSR